MVMVVMVAHAVVVMVMVAHAMMVMMVMVAHAMVMMMKAGEAHPRAILVDGGSVGRFHRVEHGDRIGDRSKQLGVRLRWRETRRIRSRDGGGLRPVECCQSGNGADQTGHRLVHVCLLLGCLIHAGVVTTALSHAPANL